METIDYEKILLEGEDNPTNTVWTDDAISAMRESVRQAVEIIFDNLPQNEKLAIYLDKNASAAEIMGYWSGVFQMREEMIATKSELLTKLGI